MIGALHRNHAKGPAARRKTGWSAQRRRGVLWATAFIAPSLIGTGIFVLVPFAQAVWRSFTDGFTHTFVGLLNYAELFANKAFQLASGNTLRFLGICVPLLVLLSLVFALMLNREIAGRSALRTAFLLPLSIPVASVALLWQVLFHENGLMGNLFESVGLARIDFMKTDWALACLILSYIWKNIGYDIVLFLAGLSGINPALYEASAVDGAGRVRQFFEITIPGLKGTFFTVAVLSLLNAFKAYREAYLVAGNYPHNSIYLLQHTMNNWFTALDIEKLSAAATITTLVILALVWLLSVAWRQEAQD